MKSETVISVENVHKEFYLPHQKKGSIKNVFTNIFSLSKKSFEIQHALKGVSFEIKKGEFFGIVGRNGSGKSTMLKMLAGIYQPTRGSLGVKGRVVPFIELGVGFNGELTGRENVFLNGALLGFSEKEVQKKYNDIVEFAELERFMDQKLKNYSSGMQVRLAFSVATRLAESDILLIDEVLAVGDADFQRKCFDYFKRLKREKKTVVFVSHDMSAVQEYCDRAVLIQDGVVAALGSSEKVSNEYLKIFNQSGKGKTEGDDYRWGDGSVVFESIEVVVKGDTVVFMITAECMGEARNDVVIGVRVLDSDRKVIAGVSTLNAQDGKKVSFKSNEKKKLNFSMPNIFGTGSFKIGARIRMSDNVTVCDDWTDATELRITRANSYYPIVLPAKLNLSK